MQIAYGLSVWSKKPIEPSRIYRQFQPYDTNPARNPAGAKLASSSREGLLAEYHEVVDDPEAQAWLESLRREDNEHVT